MAHVLQAETIYGKVVAQEMPNGLRFPWATCLVCRARRPYNHRFCGRMLSERLVSMELGSLRAAADLAISLLEPRSGFFFAFPADALQEGELRGFSAVFGDAGFSLCQQRFARTRLGWIENREGTEAEEEQSDETVVVVTGKRG